MTNLLTDILALLTAFAGWYYLFYSRAAHNLVRIEGDRTNRLRVRLRRVCGVCMTLLGAMLFLGVLDRVQGEARVLAAWMLGVLILLAAIVVLACIDVRLTWKLRHRRGSEPR